MRLLFIPALLAALASADASADIDPVPSDDTVEVDVDQQIAQPKYDKTKTLVESGSTDNTGDGQLEI